MDTFQINFRTPYSVRKLIGQSFADLGGTNIYFQDTLQIDNDTITMQ